MNQFTRNDLERCSTEELDMILNHAVAQEDYSEHEEVIKSILSILMKREKEINPEITPKIRAFWEKFLEEAKETVNI